MYVLITDGCYIESVHDLPILAAGWLNLLMR